MIEDKTTGGTILKKVQVKRGIIIVKSLVWILFSGLWLAILWGSIGVLMCLSIVGIPLGVQCFRVAKLAFLPHEKRVKIHFQEHPIGNTVWLILVGWEMALFHLIFGITSCLTIIGIGKGLQSFKIMKVALLPFGATIK